MTDDRVFTAKVGDDGVLPQHTRRGLGIVLRGYAGKAVKITIKLQALRRSASQNSYYWSVVVPHWKMIFRDGGTFMTDQEVHEYLVREVAKLQRPLIGPDGNQVKRYSKLEEAALRLLEAGIDRVAMDDAGGQWVLEVSDLIDHAAEMTPPLMQAVSTGKLSTKEFSEFVETCRAEAATEHGHDIPPPDPDYKQKEESHE